MAIVIVLSLGYFTGLAYSSKASADTDTTKVTTNNTKLVKKISRFAKEGKTPYSEFRIGSTRTEIKQKFGEGDTGSNSDGYENIRFNYECDEEHAQHVDSIEFWGTNDIDIKQITMDQILKVLGNPDIECRTKWGATTLSYYYPSSSDLVPEYKLSFELMDTNGHVSKIIVETSKIC
jgi:hypothetical protein